MPELQPATLDEIRALLSDIRDDLHHLRELSERIRLLLPEEVLIEKAYELSRQQLSDFGFRSLLDELRKRYNAVNLSRLRHAVARAEHA